MASLFNVLTKQKNSGSSDSGEPEMGFFDHLEVLRWHIIRSVLSIGVFGIIFFLAKSFTFDTIIYGPKRPTFITYELICKLAPSVCFRPPSFDLITREMGEQFFIHMSVSFWLGLICSFPYILWEFWRFIKPGLYPDERNSVGGFVFYCSFLFFLGIAFGYFIIAPFAISWLASYSVGTEAINAPTLASYVSYMTMFTIPTGITFELPMIVYILGKMGIVTSSFMRSYRRHAIVIIFIIAAIVTPPDVITQLLISAPVLILYEVSIAILKRLEKKRAQANTSSNLPDINE